MNQTEFCSSVDSLIESLWPTVGPHKIIEFNDNMRNPDHYTALVLCYVGANDNAIVKSVYKVWISSSVLVYKLVAKAEWPTGI